MMSPGIFLLVSFFSIFAFAEGSQPKLVEDVTTIYKLTEDDVPVEIHSRTNALGVSPYTEFGFLEAENTVDDLLCWFPYPEVDKETCGWTIDGFTWETDEDSYGDYKSKPTLFKRDLIVKLCEDLRENEYYIKDNSYYIHRSEDPSEDRSCETYIFANKTEGHFYKIETKSRCNGCGRQSSLSFCVSYVDDPFDVKRSSCSVIEIFQLGSENPLFVSLETNQNNLKLWYGKDRNSLLVDRVDCYLNDSLKTAISYHDLDINPAEILHFKVLKTSTRSSTLTSPVVIAPRNDFCLRVVFYAGTDINVMYNDVMLYVYALDSLNIPHLLGGFNSDKAGWHSWKLEKTLPKDLQGQPISIQLLSAFDSLIKIQRIASCNVEDKEEVSIITSNMIHKANGRNTYSSENFPFNGGKAYSSFELKQVSNKDVGFGVCRNGGNMTEAGCACPAGFTGIDCNKACGYNRFGQDCGGKCSKYTKGCRGLLLCTPGAGCSCAPGYSGPRCTEECVYGTYGANCSQKCADMGLQGNCNKYTGHYSKCKPGFYPPYCTEKYTYLKTAPVVLSNKYQTLSVTVNLTKENIAGYGKPIFYQLQFYRLQDYNDGWEVFTTKYIAEDEEIIEVEMTDMVDAAEYRIRVVLLADDYNSYQRWDLPFTRVHTKCDIPDSYNYNMTVSPTLYEHYHYQYLDVHWSYNLDNHWCPLINYEFWWKEGWQWKNKTVNNARTTFDEVFPGEEFTFKVRARTISGFAPFSTTLISPGMYDKQGSYQVESLKAVSVQRNSVSISWDPPAHLQLQHSNVTYMVNYECLRHPSCSLPCESSGSLNTTATTTLLGPLLPAAQYEVSVSADFGSKTFLYFRTLESSPEETPKKSEKEFIRTNSSATVFWEPAEVCSGFFNIYHYQLTLASNSSRTLVSGTTRETSVTFNQLQASTDYSVCVSVETTGGWDPAKCLLINISTAATVPEQVANLTVYKKSRNMVGLRWSEPKALYGELESFTVSYSHQNAPSTSVSVKPKRCVPWPALYCHSVEGLKPAKLYNFTVKARNKEIHEDGAGAFVVGQTRESSPGAPENLTVINVTSSSLGLQWEHPNLANGVLRSFLVSIEETEQYDQEQCCQIYPIIEIPVSEEQKSYQLEVSGLHPASMYTVSVSGKTIGFGPSQTLSASTRPPMTAFIPPEVELNQDVEEWTWMPQSRQLELNNSQAYFGLIKSRILLVLTNGSQVVTGIEDENLKTLLEEQISTPFYLAAEHEEGASVSLGTSSEGDSQWGFLSDPPLQSGLTYQLAAVQISEYNKVLNVGVILSNKFQAQ